MGVNSPDSCQTLFQLVSRRRLLRLVAMAMKARKCSGLRSLRRCRRPQPASQDTLRSTTQRLRPNRAELSLPRRAMWSVLPRSQSHRH